MDIFLKLFDPTGFVPRALCGDWTSGLIWLHNVSDFFIWTAYLAIPIVLLAFAHKRRDELPFRQLFGLFGLFILACGTTHLLDIVLFYYPVYRLAGVVKFITAVASWGTVMALISIVPRALAMRTPETLEREIDERIRIEGLLKQERGFLQTLLDNADAGIVACDENGVLTLFNRTSREFHGLPVAPISFEQWAEHFDLYRSDGKTPLPETEIPLLRALRGETVRDAEMVIAPKGGMARTLSANAQAINDEDGNSRGAIVVMHDITERKRIARELQQAHDDLEARVVQRTLELAHANAELEKSSAQLHAILDNAPAVIYLKDTQGRYLFVNHQFETLFDVSRAQIIGKAEYEIFPTEIADVFVANDQKVLQSDSAMELEEEAPQADGMHTYISIKFPLHVANGSAYAVCGISTDITQRKRDQLALQAAKDEAEHANRAKSQLLSRTSHELRTPLNAILGFGQLLEMDDLDDAQRRSVALILKAGRHQLALVDRILDVARIESQELEVEIETLALEEILPQALEAVRALATTHQVQLRLEESLALTKYVLADRARLLQVLANLLSNAIRFNHAGGEVSLSCQLAPDNDRLHIAVSDTGHGIAPAELGRLFTLFDRLGADEAGIEGTGIGLALARGLITAMNGTLSVQTTLGQGSTFTIELPMAPSLQESSAGHGEAALALAASRANEVVVLYIEDNLSNLELVEFILRQRPAIRVLVAMHGQRGLEIARAQKPDLILLDLHLPDIDGDELLRVLREDDATRAIPVIIISADATPGQIARLKAKGARDYLTKPLDIKQFQQVLEENLTSKVPTTVLPPL